MKEPVSGKGRRSRDKMESGEEPMEFTPIGYEMQNQDFHDAQAWMTSPPDSEVFLTLSFKWLAPDRPQKIKKELELLLQSWFNKNTDFVDCTVVRILGDTEVLIKLQPVPALSVLQRLIGQKLKYKKDKEDKKDMKDVKDEKDKEDKNKVTIMSISLTLLDQDTQITEDASVNPPPSMSEPKHDQVQQVEQSSAVSAAEEDKTNTVLVPVGHFLYVSHIYKEEVKRIEKNNGVQMKAEVKVTFESKQEDGSPQNAEAEFTSLVQKHLTEYSGSTVPLKNIDPDNWSDTMNIIQKNDNKLLLTLSSEEMNIYGPKHYQDTVCKFLLATQKTNTNASPGESKSEDTSQKINMTINNPLRDEGVTMEESCWKMINTSFIEQLAKIKYKFDVDFKVSDNSQGKVNVKACYRRRNPSMESHAIRALLRLYQKISTSPMGFTSHQTSTGFSGPLEKLSFDYQADRPSNRPVPNGQSAYSMDNAEERSAGGATATDKDENCPICMDTFTNKKQLKCKHEFCEECLRRYEKSVGPTCPICKDVFGVIEGDQPEGTMSTRQFSSSLPGFPDCGTIEIIYNIPSGKQTEKHPKPGHYYSGITRQAYLPDNKEGKEVLQLLRRAFDQKLIFTVGTSRTTGMDDQVIWNDIPHKTSVTGGPQMFGYPDPDYLSRVKDELKAKGISSHRAGGRIDQYVEKSAYSMDMSKALVAGGATAADKDENCPICMDTFTNKKQLKCKHEFCEECLRMSEKTLGPTCPICKDVFGVMKGDQPEGTMSTRQLPSSLPGFPHCGTIVITYNIPSGKQTEKHPKPGHYYSGITRHAFLPDNKEGKEVLQLLRRAFDQKLIFTVGTSRTTGMDDQVTWNNIHHKTSMTGGPQMFGYPDPDYLSRVKDELKAKGIK